MAVSSVSDLVHQMHQNLEAIHQHLTRISDTKTHDDEIERLENERQKRVDELKAQREREANELADRKKQAAEAAAEKRRQERAKVEARRKQEEEEIVARRKREDEERQARLEQEEEELKAIAQKEEEEREAIHAAEAEKKRLEAEEKENGVYDEVDSQMTQLEDEMEKRMAEGQKALKDLDEKRKAINAMIDAQMNPSAVKPIFRRGSKRYSASPLAADVAAMLARRNSPEHKPSPLKNGDHSSEPAKEEESPTTDIPAQETNGDASKEDSNRGEAQHEAPAGEVPSTAHEQDAATNQTSAVQQPAHSPETEHVSNVHDTPSLERTTPEKISRRESKPSRFETEIPKDLPTPAPSEDTPRSIERVMSSNNSIRSTRSEDPEDIRAREEMARINAEIIAEMEAAERAAAAAQTAPEADDTPTPTSMKEPEVDQIVADTMQGATLEPSPPQSTRQSFEDPEDARAREEMARINAEILAESQGDEEAQKRHSLESGPMEEPEPVTRQAMEDPEDVRAREEMERLNAEIKAETLAAEQAQVKAPQLPTVVPHGHLPTWATNLPIVRGLHGVLNFRKGGADMEVVEPPKVEAPPAAQRMEEKFTPYVYEGPFHQHLPTWATDLPVVRGSHGVLNFRDGGADMDVVDTPQLEDAPEPQIVEITPFVYRGPSHAVLPTWQDQAEIPEVRSSGHGMLVFREGGADMTVVDAPIHEDPQVSPPKTDNLDPFRYGVTQHDPSITFADQSKLPVVSGTHAVLVFREGGADMSAVEGPQLEQMQAEDPPLPPILEAPIEAPNSSRDIALPETTVPEAIWFGQAKTPGASRAHGHPHNLTRLDSTEEFMSNMPGHFKTSMPVTPEARLEEPKFLPEAQGESPEQVQQALPIVEEESEAEEVPEEKPQESSPVREVPKPEPEPENQLPGHLLQRFPFLAARMAARNEEAASHLPTHIKQPLPLAVPKDEVPVSEQQIIAESIPNGLGSATMHHSTTEEEFPVIEQQVIAESIPNGLGSATMNHGTEPTTPLKVVAAENMPEEVVVVAGDTYDLEHPALEELVQSHNDPYWADQATLENVQGTHAQLVFQDGLATMQAIQAPRPPHPYWIANQADLQILRGSNAMLNFRDGDAGADMEVVVVNDHVSAKKNPYWEPDQASLDTITGSHATLVFTPSGADMKVAHAPVTKEILAKPTETGYNSYWSADQKTLALLKGNHGLLSFRAGGADMEVVILPPLIDAPNPKKAAASAVSPSTNPTAREETISSGHPYWSVDQSTLSPERGTHAVLAFSDKGASTKVVRALHPYWSVPSQGDLEVFRGTHATLHFNDEGAAMHIAEARQDPKDEILNTARGESAPANDESPEPEVSHSTEQKASGASVPSNPAAYWQPDQAQLQTFAASHGMLVFDDKGAYMIPHELPLHEPVSPVDHHDSSTPFENEAIPPAVTADSRFPIDDSDGSDDSSLFTERGEDRDDDVASLNPFDDDNEVAQPDDHDSWSASEGSDHIHHRSLSDVPDLESDPTVELQHENHHFSNSTGSHEADPEPEDSPVDENFHHDAKRNSEHMLFEDSDDDESEAGDNYQDAEDIPTQEPPHRTSMGPGAFASLVNIVKDNVPLVGQIVDSDKGSYTPVTGSQSLRREPSMHIRTDTTDTFPSSEVYSGSHGAESSPITPSNTSPSPVHLHHRAEEPVIRSAWPETDNHHEADFNAYDSQESIKPQASPHQSQTEFDPYSPQAYAPSLKSPASIRSFHTKRLDTNDQAQVSPVQDEFDLDPRSQYRPPGVGSPESFRSKLPQLNTTLKHNDVDFPPPSRRSTDSRPQSRDSRPSQIPTRSHSSLRRGTVTERPPSSDTGRTPNSTPTAPSNNFFAKTRALFENAASGPTVPEVPRNRPISGIFHVSPIKTQRSSLSRSEFPSDENELQPRSLDSNPKPPSPGYRLPAGQSPNRHEEDEDDYPPHRNSNPFLGALGAIGSGLSSSIHNPANTREKERLLGSEN